MRSASYFANDYTQARAAFLRAASDAGAAIRSFRNDRCAGPDGGELYTDVATVGEAGPDAVVLVSGTHGIEGFCGSAIQVGLLSEFLTDQPPAGLTFVLVHALNPYGFAHERRVNEDNVDLNRNFVDHAAPPHNPGYDELHAALVPAAWQGEPRQEADAFLATIAADRGVRYLQQAVTRGQYRHPDGLFYGGTEPVWSHRLLRSIVREQLTRCRRIAYIDLHTGLGPRGHGEPIFRGGADLSALPRARAWYGEALTMSEDGTSSSTPIIGNTASLVARELAPRTELTAITLEFGTIPGLRVLEALRADNWLRLQPASADRTGADTASVDRALVAQIRHQMREAFAPSDCAWRGAVWARAKEVFGQTLAGMAMSTVG